MNAEDFEPQEALHAVAGAVQTADSPGVHVVVEKQTCGLVVLKASPAGMDTFKLLPRISQVSTRSEALRKEASADSVVGGPTLGSLSPVWIRQRLEREWQRAEEAEEELQAALARRDVAEADTAKLKVTANRLANLLLEADKEITRLTMQVTTQSKQLSVQSTELSAKCAELATSRQQLQTHTDQLEAGRAAAVQTQKQLQELQQKHGNLVQQLEDTVTKGAQAVNLLNAALPESVRHGQLTGDCITGVCQALDFLKALIALQPKTASRSASRCANNTPRSTSPPPNRLPEPTSLLLARAASAAEKLDAVATAATTAAASVPADLSLTSPGLGNSSSSSSSLHSAVTLSPSSRISCSKFPSRLPASSELDDQITAVYASISADPVEAHAVVSASDSKCNNSSNTASSSSNKQQSAVCSGACFPPASRSNVNNAQQKHADNHLVATLASQGSAGDSPKSSPRGLRQASSKARQSAHARLHKGSETASNKMAAQAGSSNSRRRNSDSKAVGQVDISSSSSGTTTVCHSTSFPAIYSHPSNRMQLVVDIRVAAALVVVLLVALGCCILSLLPLARPKAVLHESGVGTGSGVKGYSTAIALQEL